MQNTGQISPQQLTALALTLTADNLHPHQNTRHPLGGDLPNCMTDNILNLAIRTALGPVLEKVQGFRRYATQIAIENAVRAALPPIAGTVAEYAASLRETAREFRLAA